MATRVPKEPSSVNPEDLYENFLQKSLGELKDYLSLRGLSVTGKKRELVARAFSACERNVRVVVSDEELRSRLTVEYQQRIKSLPRDPRHIAEDEWRNDMTTWPALDLGKVFSFILSKKEFDSDYVGKYKLCKAYSYFVSGFVGTVYSHTFVSTGECILKCKVTPSQRVRDEPREVWVAIDTNQGGVLSAWCSCTAGYSQSCNHVMALLYKVEHAVSMGFTNPSCTSVPCRWNDRTFREVEPKKIRDLKIRTDSHNNTNQERREINSDLKKTFDPRRECERAATEESKNRFLAKWKKITDKSVIFKAVEVEEESHDAQDLPLPLNQVAEKFASEHKGEGEVTIVTGFLESPHLSQNQCDSIEKATRAQSQCTEWVEQRKGRITASKFHEVHTKVKTLLAGRKKVVKTKPLIARIVHHQSLNNVPAVQWGRAHEKEALDAFVTTEGPKHTNMQIFEAGLFVKRDLPYIGASPDAIGTCDCCGTFVVECKCPYSIKGERVLDAWNRTEFLQMDSGKVCLNKGHKYYTQLQGEIVLSNCFKGYFVVWTQVGDPLVEEVQRDEVFYQTVEQDLVFFYKGYVVKVLLGLVGIFYCPKCECLCLEPDEIEKDGENSVCCDQCALWYHWECEDLTIEPEELHWLCSSCKQLYLIE